MGRLLKEISWLEFREDSYQIVEVNESANGKCRSNSGALQLAITRVHSAGFVIVPLT